MAGRSSAELVPFFAAIRFTLFFVFLESSKPCETVDSWQVSAARDRRELLFSRVLRKHDDRSRSRRANPLLPSSRLPLSLFSFFFFRGTKRSSQEVVDIVGGAVSGKGWGTRLDGDGMERSHKPFYKGTKSIPPGVPRFCNETGICMLLWTRKLSEMAARRSLSDLL